MAISFSFTLSVSLLIFSFMQGYCGQDHERLYNRDDSAVTATREVIEALQYLDDTAQDRLNAVQDSLRLQKTNNDMVSLLKQVLDKHSENENSNKQEIEALNKVITLTKEVMDLKIQSTNNDRKVSKIIQENLDLKNLLDNYNQTVYQLDNTLGDYDRQVQELQQQVKELNDTVQAQKLVNLTRECQQHTEKIKAVETQDIAMNQTVDCEQQPHLEEVEKLVEAFDNSSDWSTLIGDLHATLDQQSVEFSQLHYATSQDSVGFYNYIQLITLLLCAGLPVDSADSDGLTMLHGAARGEHLQLVKLLLDHGASVNVSSRYGQTPLIYAAFRDSLELVQLLVQAGADTTARDNYGNNALDEARKWHRKEVEQYLVSLPH